MEEIRRTSLARSQVFTPIFTEKIQVPKMEESSLM